VPRAEFLIPASFTHRTVISLSPLIHLTIKVL
jgi:hypothetical protein